MTQAEAIFAGLVAQAAGAEIAGDIERLTAAMRRDAVGREQPAVK